MMKIDRDLLYEFEEGLDTIHPENSKISLKILGYGEISTVFEILHEKFEGIAFKRLPLFNSEEKALDYIKLYGKYNELLGSIGIETPEHGGTYIVRDDGLVIVYLYQEKLPSFSICNKVIHRVSDQDAEKLFNNILNKMSNVWHHNNENRNSLLIGLDGQISNWAIRNYSGENILPNKLIITYLDTSTPLIRENGKELIDAELFLKATPPILRWILKKLYLQKILDRYYDFYSVILDLIANLYKEKRADLIPRMIEIANNFFDKVANEIDVSPRLASEDVDKYYKSDASIWSIYLTTRKIHRFIRTRILRSYYEFILPETIER